MMSKTEEGSIMAAVSYTHLDVYKRQALINAGLTTLLSIGLLYFSGKEMDGHTITSACLMFGFSLFGKNIVNIWAIMAGVVLYAKYHGCLLYTSRCV